MQFFTLIVLFAIANNTNIILLPILLMFVKGNQESQLRSYQPGIIVNSAAIDLGSLSLFSFFWRGGVGGNE